MRCLLLVLCIIPFGCAEKLITLGSTGLGSATGGLVGGPGGAAIGGMLGYSGAELVGMQSSQDNIAETITKNAVQQIVENNMQEHKTGFEAFKNTIQKLLIYVAIGLLIYLCIPIFVAKYSAEKCTKDNLTRPPFPTNEKHKTTGRNI